jgi:hypothetical protein
MGERQLEVRDWFKIPSMTQQHWFPILMYMKQPTESMPKKTLIVWVNHLVNNTIELPN